MGNKPEGDHGPALYHRRSIRLRGYDYSLAGAYFITICTQDKVPFFGDVADEQLQLNDAGLMVQTSWERLPYRFPYIELDAGVVMPNHFHAILAITSQPIPHPGAGADIPA